MVQMLRCSECGVGLRELLGEVVDAGTGFPHRLTCRERARFVRLTVRSLVCEICRERQRHQVVYDRKGELRVCYGCGHGETRVYSRERAERTR